MNSTHKIGVIDKLLYYYQTPFIVILNFIFKTTKGLNDKKRNDLIIVLCYVLPIFYIAFYSGLFGRPTFVTQPIYTVVGTVIFISLIIISTNMELKHVHWRSSLMLPMILGGIGIVIIGFVHTIGSGFQSFGFQLIFVFPPFFIVWNNRQDYEILYNGLSKGTAAVVFLYFGLCLVLALFGEFTSLGTRWAGTMTNVNLLSQIGTNAALLCMYMIVTCKNNKLLYCCVLGIGFGFSLLGGSRGATGTCILCATTAIVYVLTHSNIIKTFQFEKGRIVRAVVCVLAIVLFFIFTYAGLPTLQNKMTSSKSQIENNVNDETSIERMRIEKYGDINSFTSGRVDIWKEYINQLNAFGHDYDSTNWDKITTTKNAHNIFLEISYRCGVPIALLFIYPQIIAGLMALFLLFSKNKRDPNHVFFILFFLEYFYESTVDVAIMPFHRFTVLLFYISLASVISIKNRRLKENE